MEKVGNTVFGCAIFVASLVTTLALTDRLNHDGAANIPIVGRFFPEPTTELTARHIVGPSLLPNITAELPRQTVAQTVVTHPDAINTVFRPSSGAAPHTAKIGFQFRYNVVLGNEGDAFERITAKWQEATAATEQLLRHQNTKLLTSRHGTQILKHDLIAALNRTLFADGSEAPVAAITELVWKDWLMQ